MLPEFDGCAIAGDADHFDVFEIDFDVARLGEALVAFLLPGLAVQTLGRFEVLGIEAEIGFDILLGPGAGPVVDA